VAAAEQKPAGPSRRLAQCTGMSEVEVKEDSHVVAAPRAQSCRNPLKRPSARAVYRVVSWILRWPRYACRALVSTPSPASL
jgi:hypothetical protein